MSVTVTNEQFGFHRPESHQLSNDLTKARSLRSVQACFQVFFYLAILLLRLKMSDFQDISTSVVVHGAPKVEKFTPMSGQNAGKEQTVLNFRAYHPNFQRQEDGSFKMLDSDWYDVKYNGKAIEQVQGLLKDGMTLEVRGSMRERVWKDRDGNDRTSHEVFAKSLGLSLTQPGLTGVEFQKPDRNRQAQAEPTKER